MRASGQGPSPAGRVWGKFGEVCLAATDVPKAKLPWIGGQEPPGVL